MSLFFHIKKNFIKGIAIVLPLSLTWYIFSFIINFISFQLQFIHRYINIPLIKNIPYSEILIIFFIIITVGLISNLLHLESILYIFEDYILKKIPIVRTIYNAIKQITKTIKRIEDSEKTTSEKNNTVAWVKIPHQGFYALGIFTGELEEKYNPSLNKKFFSFFIPTTPNPMTGHYIIAEENEFVFISMTRQEALSIIISGGIVRPEEVQ